MIDTEKQAEEIIYKGFSKWRRQNPFTYYLSLAAQRIKQGFVSEAEVRTVVTYSTFVGIGALAGFHLGEQGRLLDYNSIRGLTDNALYMAKVTSSSLGGFVGTISGHIAYKYASSLFRG